VKPTITKGLGALTPEVWSQLYALVQGQGADGGVPPSVRNERARGGDRERFLAKITAANQVSSRAIWQYEWVQVRVLTAENASPTITTVTNGHSDTAQGAAWNILEMANTESKAFGFDVTNGVDLNDFDGFAIEPVPTDTVVQMWFTRATDGSLRAEFAAPNPINGTCPEPPAPLVNTYDYGSFITPSEVATAYDAETFGAPNTTVLDFEDFS
jgi:hypothetical protein